VLYLQFEFSGMGSLLLVFMMGNIAV